MKKMLILVLAFALLVASFAMADRPAETTVGASGTLNATSTAGNATAQGGNVTNVDLEGTYSTLRWQGFYGNVSATLQLGLVNDVFYDFGSVDVNAVYATQNNTFNFATAVAVTGVGGLDTAWGYASGDDQIADVYTVQITNDGYTDALGVIRGNFRSYVIGTVVAPDAKANVAFGANINTGAGFNAGDRDYELMVPADGTETYYFFMSI
jgi:hypothetical protein